MNNTAVDELINTLYNLIEEAPNAMFGGGRCTVNREDVLNLLDEVRNSLPADLKMAREIVEKRNEVLSAGKRESDSMKKQAEELARQMINEHDIVVSARRQAAEIVDAAETKARDTKSQAEEHAREVIEKADSRAQEVTAAAKAYCENYMQNAETTIQKALTEVQETHNKFQLVWKD